MTFYAAARWTRGRYRSWCGHRHRTDEAALRCLVRLEGGMYDDGPSRGWYLVTDEGLQTAQANPQVDAEAVAIA